MASRPTLDQLRVLVAVAQTGTFAAAARKLGHTQPAISQTIQQLEASLGVSLFDRSGKGARLNAITEGLVADAQTILSKIDELCAKAGTIASDVERELVLAVDGTISRTAVVQSIRAVAQEFPDVTFSIFTEGFGGAEELLLAEVVQLAFYFPSLGRAETGIASIPLAYISSVAVAAPTHPMARVKGPLTRQILAEHVHLLMSDRKRSLAPASGAVATNRRWLTSDVSTLLEMLLQGLGWGHMPLDMVHEHLAAGTLVRLELPDGLYRLPGAELHAVHTPGRPPGPAGRALIREVGRRISEIAGHPPDRPKPLRG